MEFSLIIDALIAVLLVATIAYAAVLNRKLGVLRDGKTEMEVLIASFSESTARAGSGVESLKQEAGRSGEALQNKVETARGLVDDLGFLIESGTRLAERLDGGLGAARAKLTRAQPTRAKTAAGLAAEPAPTPPSQMERPAAAVPKAEAEAARANGASGETAGETAGGADTAGDPAPGAAAADISAAESDLLKALQGMR